ncbi:hypothetical protein CPB85DRAFT_1435631 [Mucidula mucida]|nr:hypothetical protein CPB85DRAFT_1435631 [Mucidula mucida]
MALQTSMSNVMCPSQDEPVQALVEPTGHREHSLAQDLPPELVNLIFWQAKPERWCIDWREGIFGRNMLWTGAQVCGQWRAALLGNPRLWSRSSIDLVMFATRSVPLLCGPLAVQTLFSRTADLPIHVEFILHTPTRRKLWISLWTSRLDAQASPLASTLPICLLRREVGTYPVLRRLTISTDAKWVGMSYCDGACIDWDQFPLLRELSLQWYMHDVGPLPSVHQLTKLDIIIGRFGSISLVIPQLLHESTTLRDVRLHVKGEFSRWTQSIAFAPQVERLKLEDKGTYVLEHMTLPALRSLFMEVPRWDSWHGLEPAEFLTILSNSSAGRSYAPPQVFDLVVHHQPWRLGSVADLFSALRETTAGGNMRIVPVLERLRVSVITERDVDVDISLGGHFVEAVLKRTEAVDSALPGTWDLQESDLQILKEREGQVDGLEILVIDKARPRVFDMDSDSDVED